MSPEVKEMLSVYWLIAAALVAALAIARCA